MIDRRYSKLAVDKTMQLLAIDSPSGYTAKAAEWVAAEFRAMGFAAEITGKGGVLADLGGRDSKDAILLEAHTDTLGGMVCEIKSNGRLRITNIGGLRAENTETENVRVHTRSGKVIEGTCNLINASTHVNRKYDETKRDFSNVEIILDEDVRSAEDVRALGIEIGRAHV